MASTIYTATTRTACGPEHYRNGLPVEVIDTNEGYYSRFELRINGTRIGAFRDPENAVIRAKRY